MSRREKEKLADMKKREHELRIREGVQAQSLECYFCTDLGGGNCSQEAIQKTPCSLDHDACIESVVAVETSHDQYTMMMKGCGYGMPGRMDKAMPFFGMTMYIQVLQCNTSLCNTNLNLKDFQLKPPDNTTQMPNDVECYNCIGKTEDQCMSANAPVRTCYNSYSNCFDGNATVTLGNTSAVIPIKSCSARYICAVQTVTFGSATYEMKGACCVGNVCNQDLSNNTQYVDLPPLVLLNQPSDQPAPTVATPQWLTPVYEQPQTVGTTKTNRDVEYGLVSNSTVSSKDVEDGVVSNATVSSSTVQHVDEDHGTSNSWRPQTSIWLVIFFVLFGG
ncbi:ly6/PLAUR domain-containing protein 3 [Pelodytes ibericus]